MLCKTQLGVCAWFSLTTSEVIQPVPSDSLLTRMNSLWKVVLCCHHCPCQEPLLWCLPIGNTCYLVSVSLYLAFLSFFLPHCSYCLRFWEKYIWCKKCCYWPFFTRTSSGINYILSVASSSLISTWDPSLSSLTETLYPLNNYSLFLSPPSCWLPLVYPLSLSLHIVDVSCKWDNGLFVHLRLVSSIGVVFSMRIPFALVPDIWSSVCLHHDLFACPSVCAHSGRFCFLAVEYKADVNIGVPVSARFSDSCFWGVYPRVKLAV